MTENNGQETRQVPLRALILSLLALLIPVLADLTLPRDLLGIHQPLLWLVPLIPAFLLAYHKGWKGAATALAAGMATLTVTQAVANYLGQPVPDLLIGVVVAYLALSLGIGWLAEQLHRDREEVEDLAFTDLLTHLPNRRHARVFLENEFAAAERGRLLSVVLFDLDNFKRYNDRFGHQAGDEALLAFSEILARTTRRMNLSARFGGEEFLTVLAGSDVEGALVFAERVRTTLRTTKLSHGSLTVSAGVAAYHPSMRSPDELLGAADHALYQAKREGRNCVRLFGRRLIDEAVADAQERPGDSAPVEDTDYPRDSDEIGRSRPPVTLLPHQVTGFGAGRKILLVEDEDAVRGLLSSYFTKEGFNVTEAEDVTSAVQALDTEFDVVATDLKLPGEWGMELVKAVKARWPGTQVVVVTGVKDAEITSQAIKAGADRYLLKPFGIPELRAEISDALTRRDRIVMERSRRRLASTEAMERGAKSRESVIRAANLLAEAAEIRDPYILGHHAMVPRFAGEILDALDPEGVSLSRDSLLLGAGLIDIGKLEVPDSVLNKPGPLTSEEMQLIHRHPTTGQRLMETLIDDEVAIQVVAWHHERWDGKGYPTGLIGEGIPIPARIAALADTLDALLSVRPYRDALPWEEAVDVILNHSEGHFDPAVLKAFREALPRLESLSEG